LKKSSLQRKAVKSIAIRGVEDLGDGLMAGLQLESGLSPDTGSRRRDLDAAGAGESTS